MCKIYNSVGSLTTVKSHLHRHKITDFKSLNEVISFQKGYIASRERIISNSEILIEQEKSNIDSENLQLKNAIEVTKEALKKKLLEQTEHLEIQLQKISSLSPRDIWQKVFRYLKIAFVKKKIRIHELTSPFKVSMSVRHLVKWYQKNENRYNYIDMRFQDAVIENCSADLKTLEKKKALIDEVNSSIYGAIGEQKVEKELQQLPDDHVLINDFCLSFSPAIVKRNEKMYIKSIQVDHLLIGPSGVFLIETKNWSEQSLNNLKLRSPVLQIKRSGFAVFMVLNEKTKLLGLNMHHWGKKKIPVRNLLVLINRKPTEEFQYVKVLKLSQLLSYIKYFPPIYTQKEVERIANKLIGLSKK